jgi:GNAT superfamily N-acetyltransferase
MAPRSATRIVAYEPRWRQGAIDVVRAVYDEYGFTWEADGYHRDLHTVPETYLETGGGFWVLILAAENGLDDSDRVVGTMAFLDRGDGVAEGERLYLLKAGRGQGDGERLLRHAIEAAGTRGFRRFIGWSDKRFHEAHALYAKAGMRRTGERILDDPDESPEWGFELDLIEKPQSEKQA